MLLNQIGIYANNKDIAQIFGQKPLNDILLLKGLILGAVLSDFSKPRVVHIDCGKLRRALPLTD